MTYPDGADRMACLVLKAVFQNQITTIVTYLTPLIQIMIRPWGHQAPPCFVQAWQSL